MLCINLFISQLLFLIGINQTKYKVRHTHTHTQSYLYRHLLLLLLLYILVGMYIDINWTSVHVPSHVHVDANGGCGPLHIINESVH